MAPARVAHPNQHILEDDKAPFVLERLALYALGPNRALAIPRIGIRIRSFVGHFVRCDDEISAGVCETPGGPNWCNAVGTDAMNRGARATPSVLLGLLDPAVVQSAGTKLSHSAPGGNMTA